MKLVREFRFALIHTPGQRVALEPVLHCEERPLKLRRRTRRLWLGDRCPIEKWQETTVRFRGCCRMFRKLFFLLFFIFVFYYEATDAQKKKEVTDTWSGCIIEAEKTWRQRFNTHTHTYIHASHRVSAKANELIPKSLNRK